MRTTRRVTASLLTSAVAIPMGLVAIPAAGASASVPPPSVVKSWSMSTRPGNTPTLKLRLSSPIYGAGYSNPGSGHYTRVLSGGIGAGTHLVPTAPLGCNDKIGQQGEAELVKGYRSGGKVFTFQRKCGGLQSSVSLTCPADADKQFRVAITPTLGEARNANTWTLRLQNGQHLYVSMSPLSDGTWEGFVTAPARNTQLDRAHPGGSSGLVSFTPLGDVAASVAVTGDCVNLEGGS